MTASEQFAARRPARWAWLVWAAAVLFFSVAPPGWILGAVPRSGWSLASTAGHVGESAVFAVLFWWAHEARGAAGRRVLLAGAAALAFGLFIELVQWPIPYRSFDLLDWAADAVGVAIGLVAVTAWRLWGAAARGRRRAYSRPRRHNR